MSKPLTSMASDFAAELDAIEQDMAERWGAAALGAAVKSAPGPEKTKTSTGRYRESLHADNGQAVFYDPGAKAFHSVPTIADAAKVIRRRRRGQSVVVSSSVYYASFVEDRYRSILAAHLAGAAALRGEG